MPIAVGSAAPLPSVCTCSRRAPHSGGAEGLAPCASQLLSSGSLHKQSIYCRFTPFRSYCTRSIRLDRHPAGAVPTSAAHATWIEGKELSSKPRQQGTQLLFYTHTLCPYAQRVHATLLEKGTDFQLVHIDLAVRPGWFDSLSRLVPVVEYPEGSLHRESLDICRWLDETFEGPPLLPENPQLRKDALHLVTSGASRFAGTGLALLGGRTAGSWGISRIHTPAQRKAFEAQLEALATLLHKHGGPYLLGPAVSLADLAYFPFAERFALGAKEFCGFDAAAAAGGALGSWLDAMRQRPAGQSSADPELFLGALKRHMRLDFFDYDSYGAADLHAR